jgi:UDP-GlcNAc:undecaprenyl-phosphate GlcNAc-1-phosphate transferase
VVLVALCYWGSYAIRFDDQMGVYSGLLLQSLPIVIGCQILSFVAVGVYRGTWRYISLSDATTFAKGIALGTVSSVIVLVYLYRFEGYSRGVFLIYAMTTGICVVAARLSERGLADIAGRHRKSGRRTLIYGAGDAAALLLRELRNQRHDFQPVGLLDDDSSKHHRRILGVQVLGGIEAMQSSIASRRAEVIIVSTSRIGAARMASIRETCYVSGTTLLQFSFRLDHLRLEPSPRGGRDGQPPR